MGNGRNRSARITMFTMMILFILRSVFVLLLPSFSTMIRKGRTFMAFHVKIVIRSIRVDLQVIIMRLIIPNWDMWAARRSSMCGESFPRLSVVSLSYSQGGREGPRNSLQIKSRLFPSG